MFSTKDKEAFFLGDLDIFIDTDTSPSAYTRAEKPISFSAEFAEFLEGIPQVLVRKDLTRFGMAIAVELMQWTAKIINLARGGELVESGPDFDFVYFGTDYVEPPIKKYTFSGTLRSGNTVDFVILQGKVSEMGEVPTGGTDYTGIPMLIEAQKDETEVDLSRDLAYFKVSKTAS